MAELVATKAEPQRFFFVHILKAAGTTLLIRFRHAFGVEGVYPNASDGDPVHVAPQLVVGQLEKRWPERRHEARIVAGHFPLCTASLLDDDFVTLTIVREPVERTLSYLRHHRRLTPADAETPLEEIYEDPKRFEELVHNHMTKMFSLTTAEMTGGALTIVDHTPERLERAKAGLESVDVIGLQEDFGSFCDELTGRYGLDLGKDVNANRTERFEVPTSFRRRIADDNALDMELYEHARDLVAARARA